MPLLIYHATLQRRSRSAAACAALLMLSLCAPANAADNDQRLREAVRDLRTQVEALQQQLSDETAHSEALRQKAEQAASETRDLQQKLATQTAQLAKFSTQNGQARGLLEQWRTSYDFMVDQAKRVDAERRDYAQQAADYRARVDAAQTQIATCNEKNAKLYAIGEDLIAQYKNKDFGDVLGDSEPFLQLSRAKMQGVMQSYEDRLYDAKAGVAPAPDANASKGDGK